MARKLRVQYPGAMDGGGIAPAAQERSGEAGMATRLWRETTVTLKWIRQRLAMGAWTHLNRRRYETTPGRGKETKLNKLGTDPVPDSLYYGYRSYSPSTGRWLSRDPIGEVVENNLYCVVRNQPTSRIDYLGHMTIKRCEEMVANAIESARIANLMGILDANKCPRPEIMCSCCNAYPISSPGGYWQRENNQIHICVTASRAANLSQANFTTYLVHEYVHAVQTCKKFHQGNDCADSACKEVQAYANDGRCSGLTGQAYKDCVIGGAAGSLGYNPACKDNAEQLAKEAFDKGCSAPP